MLDSIQTYIDTLRTLPWDSWQILSLLTLAGFLVGFVNTLAGSGSVITYGLFTFMGMPLGIVNGTIRMGVVVQSLFSTTRFFRHNLIELRLALQFAVPTVLGSLLGAEIGVEINPIIFRWLLICSLCVVLLILFFKPKEQKHLTRLKGWQLILLRVIAFFLIGIYGGLIHMGIGFFLVIAIQLLAAKDIDLLHANAVRLFIVMLYTPCALLIYILHSQVDFYIGGISLIGNVLGCYVASSMALKWGSSFLKWALVIIITLFIAYLVASA
jgi:hypothetical protein